MYEDDGTSTIDEILLEEDQERSCLQILQQRAQLGRDLSRKIKVKKIIENIKRNLKKNGPYSIPRAHNFIDNYEQYPEVRSLAPKVLDKIIEGESVKQPRLDCYNLLRRRMKEINNK